VLDFATTTVPKGKFEVYARKEKQLNPGWAIDAQGHETLDPQVALKGALLPLGGFGVDNGGHKGYGLGLLVDILCGVLSGGAFGDELPLPTDGPLPGKISHFFAAFKIDGFRDPARLQARHGRRAARVQGLGQSAGPRTHLRRRRDRSTRRPLYNREHGVPVHVKVWDGLEKLAGELDLPFDVEQK
jgi:L-2-hydroxycarboxylate dehydrogenase (NAD+)